MTARASNLTSEQAFFEGECRVLVATIHEDERPLQGLAGLLDWRLRGAISQFVRRGVVTGKTGEVVYLPWQLAGRAESERLRHVLLLGVGFLPENGRRRALPPPALAALERSLKLFDQPDMVVGIDGRDLGCAHSSDVQSLTQGLLRSLKKPQLRIQAWG